VTERVDVGGLSVTLVDTAGDHDTSDPIEREGVARAAGARDVADLIIVVLDRSESLTPDDQRLLDRTLQRRRLIVANKADRERRLDAAVAAVDVSAQTGEGLGEVRSAIARELTGRDPLRDPPAISNARHIALLTEARGHLTEARVAAAGATPEEFVITHLAAARACFDEVVGVRTPDDVLRHIFATFCIGK
jgi:tRNA modification GTPase